MSAFLGPIHYWLFGKIQVEEEILNNIINKANKKGYNTENLVDISQKQYGAPVTEALEDAIEHDNIHGWLQGAIGSVESRLAYTITNLVDDKVLDLDDLLEVFEENAKKCAKNTVVDNDNAETIFRLVYNNLLSGMPCDRVNQVDKVTDDELIWSKSVDIHRVYWDNINGDVSIFYKCFEHWISCFVKSLNLNFVFVKENDFYKIERL